MEKIKKEVEEIVNRETRAWDTQDVELLLTIFHPDFVWLFPKTSHSHDPMDWHFVLGRFNYKRWKKVYQDLFNSHSLARNKREIKKIEISKEGDGAFAVVDIDTLWVNSSGNEDHWKGRVCKVYTKVNNEWKLIMHTGALEYKI
jgi:ketosteroid isomerase-like protein